MRARETRDVIEVAVLPSLERALVELEGKSGSRRKARILVDQAVQQLRGVVAKDQAP